MTSAPSVLSPRLEREAKAGGRELRVTRPQRHPAENPPTTDDLFCARQAALHPQEGREAAVAGSAIVVGQATGRSRTPAVGGVLSSAQFSDHSHGYRPGRGCHTALRDVAVGWTATTLFIEGDISRCFDRLDHLVTLQTAGEKIDDNRFLRLIGQVLRAGIWRTGCGTPRSAARRRAGFSPRACRTSTWTGWTSSSKQFCCRNTPRCAQELQP